MSTQAENPGGFRLFFVDFTGKTVWKGNGA